MSPNARACEIAALMSRLAITHETIYQYDREVTFGEWRLMLRPTDSHALRVVSAELSFAPDGSTRWAYDAYGNSICYLALNAASSTLSITSHLVVDRFPNPLNAAMLQDPKSGLPILYDTADLIALGPLIRPVTEDREGMLREWIRGELHDSSVSALTLLQNLNQKIHDRLQYTVRLEEGVQSPEQTLQLGSGACRDYAWLMIEAARRLGFAARFASGYVAANNGDIAGGGSTHAWCEIFLPMLGWIEFDPTNALAESHDLIRIAATRTPAEASPVQGSIVGLAASQMFVNVTVAPAPLDDAVHMDGGGTAAMPPPPIATSSPLQPAAVPAA
jgi:transglutaminase-like putative cysteine protease